MDWSNWVVTTYATGLPSLDDLVGGWRPGELIVLASPDREASMTLALQCATYVANHG